MRGRSPSDDRVTTVLRTVATGEYRAREGLGSPDLHRFPGAVGVESGSGGVSRSVTWSLVRCRAMQRAVLLQACTAVPGLRRRRGGLDWMRVRTRAVKDWGRRAAPPPSLRRDPLVV